MGPIPRRLTLRARALLGAALLALGFGVLPPPGHALGPAPEGGPGSSGEWGAERVPHLDAPQAMGDTVPRARAPLPDTLVGRILPDTLLPPDLRAPPTPLPVAAEEDEDEVQRLPGPGPEVGPGWERAVWVWDRDALQNVRARTLAELLDQVPGVTLLRGGDYGQPTSATAFALGPGAIRVFRDGMELPPLDGGVVDLSRVAIAAVEEVRVERRPGELRVELRSLELSDPRPYTLLEVGTGDLNTNLFRGTFGHPRALGGHFIIALDRVDTQGPFRQEPGASFGAFLSYTTFLGDRGGITWDMRRMTSRRPPELWPPRNVDRTDWALRGRFRIFEGLVAHGYFQRSSLALEPEVGPEDPQWALVNQESRRQVGVELALSREHWWARGGIRDQGGPGWPSSLQTLSAGGLLPAVGGVSLGAEREGWEGEANVRVHARAWTRPLLGMSLFVEAEDGTRGVPRFIPPEVPEIPNGEDEEPGEEPPPLAPVSFDKRNGVRVGGEFRSEGFRMGAALLRIRAGALHPTGLPLDRGASPVPAGERTGFEVSGRIPLTPILPGLALEGASQFWDAGARWTYLPRHNHDARVSYHNIFFESRNLEVWADVGVRGRDGMAVFLGDPPDEEPLGTVPSYQSWFARIQVRVVTARIFVDWENFTVRDGNRDFPDRNLPATRTLFGVRWTMWN